MHVKKGDKVRVLTGADKGKEGQILKSLPSAGKVVVEGVNIKTRHLKADRGGIIRREQPIDASNVKKI